MKQIPKYSKELIEQLTLEVQPPELPTSPKGWTALNESELRRGAFMAGRRSLVEELIAALEEDNGIDSDAYGTGESSVGDGTWPYQTVAPSRVASGYSEDGDDTILRTDDFGNFYTE